MAQVTLRRRQRVGTIPISEPSEDFFLLIMTLTGYPIEKLKPIRVFEEKKHEMATYEIRTLTTTQFIKVLEEWIKLFLVAEVLNQPTGSSVLMFSNWYKLLVTMCPLKGFAEIEVTNASEWLSVIATLKSRV